jgi:peptidase M28-like protein
MAFHRNRRSRASPRDCGLPTRALAALLASAVCLAPACGGAGAGTGASEPIAFDTQRAWRDLAAIVALGPRQAGTSGAEAARTLIERELRAAGLEPQRESFTAETPAGPLAMANVYVDLAAAEGEKSPMVILCTHYDTKRLPFEFLGANDGGSGTAVLLELARCLAKAPREKVTWRLLFLDGEEAVNEAWVDPDNRYGSRHHASELKRKGQASRVEACVLLDMVGDKDLSLERETNSDPRLLGMFVQAAQAAGLADKFSNRSERIKDDHLSFMAVDIPSVDLIDFENGTANEHWHKATDTLENCSAESLGAIGRIVLGGLPAVEAYALSRR